EMKDIERASGAKIIDRDKAESELFGGSSSVEETHSVTIHDKEQLGDTKSMVKSASLVDRVYTPSEIERGVALNAALILKDPSRLKQTIAAAADVAKRDGLDLR